MICEVVERSVESRGRPYVGGQGVGACGTIYMWHDGYCEDVECSVELGL